MKGRLAPLAAEAALVGVLAFASLQVEAAAPTSLSREYLQFGYATLELQKLVGCLADRDPALARRVLDAPMGSSEQQRLSKAMVEREKFGTMCLSMPSLETNGLVFLGYLAEYMMRRYPSTANEQLPAASRATAGTGGAFEWRSFRPTDQQIAAMEVVSRCVVSQEPAAARALIATRATSENERKQFNLMQPAIASCIPAGAQVVLQPMVLRSAIGLNFYAATHQPASVTPARMEAQN